MARLKLGTKRNCFIATAVVLVMLSQLFVSRHMTNTTPMVEQMPAPFSDLPMGQLSLSSQPDVGDHTDIDRAKEGLVDIVRQEWGSKSRKAAPEGKPPQDCTNLLKHYGLCDPALLGVPAPDRLKYTDTKPFVFLHLSKCAGTSLISQLGYMGYLSFSLRLPTELLTASKCTSGDSAKCCWWREKLHNMSMRDLAPKILQQEPANDESWIDKSSPSHTL